MSQFKSTLKLLRRSPYQALAAALAMSLTFFVASIFVVNYRRAVSPKLH